MVVQLTALFPVWWVARTAAEGYPEYESSFGLWSPGIEDIRAAAVYVTAALAVIPILLLFLRVAARSIEHEPRSFRRDLGIAAGSMTAALASCWLWPIEVPFWGTKAFTADPAAGIPDQIVHGAPGLGWWLALGALLLTAWSLWLARPFESDEGP